MRVEGLLAGALFSAGLFKDVRAQNYENLCTVSTYYANANLQLSGKALSAELNKLIRGHTVIPYTASTTDVWDALKILDAYNGDPTTNQVLLLYKNVPWPADDTAGDGVNGAWNREHTWPQSFGLEGTGPDFSDLHNLRAADMNVNSARNNLWFDYCETGCTKPAHAEAAQDTAKDSEKFMPPASRRGDIARSLLYMATRYDGSETNTVNLQLTNCPLSSKSIMGKLSTLLEWHRLDPPDAVEKRRNHVVCTTYQHNRNPFVDFPELADKIYLSSDWSDPAGSSCSSNPTPTSTPFPVTSSPPSTPTTTPPAPVASPTSPPSSPVASPTPSPANGVAGDVVVVGFNSDSPKTVALLATKAIAAGTQIKITDNGWLGSSFRSGEGVATYTVPSGGISKGTVFQYVDGSSSWTTSGSFVLSTSGDSIIVYTGQETSPNFLFALLYSSDQWSAPSSSLGTTESSLPSDLTAGLHEVALVHQDNYKFSGSTSGTRAQILARISSKDNWVGSSSTVYTFTDLSFQISDSTAPSPTPSPVSQSTRVPTGAPVAPSGSTCENKEGLTWSDGSPAPCSSLGAYCASNTAVQQNCQAFCGLCGSNCKDKDPSGLTYTDGTAAPCNEIQSYCSQYASVRSACPATCGTCTTTSSVSTSMVLTDFNEPSVQLEPPSSSSVVPILAGSVGAIALVGAALLVQRRRKSLHSQDQNPRLVIEGPPHSKLVSANPTYSPEP